jgi:enoyl-CoA hydratase
VADSVRFRIDGALAWVTLDRPAARNAVDDEMRHALLAAFARVGEDPEIRAAVLTATGETFCPGADLWTGRKDPQGPLHPAHRAPS